MSTATIARTSWQILIVEDDEDSRRALTNVLEDEGFSVAAVDSCEAALDYLHRSAPELIVLDLMMRGMDGWEFRHAQKQDVGLAGIPVISISAAGKLVDADVAFALRKPLDYDEFVTAVEHYVERRTRAGRSHRARTKDRDRN